jgi:hypothetical protein
MIRAAVVLGIVLEVIEILRCAPRWLLFLIGAIVAYVVALANRLLLVAHGRARRVHPSGGWQGLGIRAAAAKAALRRSSALVLAQVVPLPIVPGSVNDEALQLLRTPPLCLVSPLLDPP